MKKQNKEMGNKTRTWKKQIKEMEKQGNWGKTRNERYNGVISPL